MSKASAAVEIFEHRKYLNHLKKVKCASSVIDNKTPEERIHIRIKLKKQLWEENRKFHIQKENFRLLQQLSYIMKKSNDGSSRCK